MNNNEEKTKNQGTCQPEASQEEEVNGDMLRRRDENVSRERVEEVKGMPKEVKGIARQGLC